MDADGLDSELEYHISNKPSLSEKKSSYSINKSSHHDGGLDHPSAVKKP